MDNGNGSTSAQDGITAQYGFHYQKIVFIYKILSTLAVDNIYTYEGIDDVQIDSVDNIEENDPLVRIELSKNDTTTAIQVKSGIISKESWAKVCGNWLLSDVQNPVLYVEKPLTIIYQGEEAVRYLVDFFQDGKDKKQNSISNKVYRKFLGQGKDEITVATDGVFRNKIVSLLDSTRIDHVSLNDLRNKAENIFIKQYCDDIHKFECAKTERYYRFEDEIIAKIDSCIGQKKPCVLGFKDVFNIICHTRDEISDNRYVIDENVVKKQKMKVAEKLVADGEMREIIQLYKVRNDTGFAIHEIVKELLYKDFRSIYADSPNSKFISTLESEAYSNHEDVYYELDNPEPREDFYATTKKELHSELMPKSSLFRNGCYIYLTGDNVPAEQRISWGGSENDSKDQYR